MNDEQYRALLEKRLLPERYIHSLNVADSARELAVIYGEDADKAYTSGLLHDVMKNAPDGEHEELFALGGVTLSPLERHNRKLWHAMSAPLFLKFKLGINDSDMLNAVRYHTTGRAGMSRLEKIVFLADYISAERDYNGVEIMRETSKKNMDSAILFAQTYTLRTLSAAGKCIHPDCLLCYNDIIINRIERKE